MLLLGDQEFPSVGDLQRMVRKKSEPVRETAREYAELVSILARYTENRDRITAAERERRTFDDTLAWARLPGPCPMTG